MLIGIAGKARSGKDTFAKFLGEALHKKYGSKYILMAFAHELKNRIQRDFDLSYDQLWGDEKEIPDRRYVKSAGIGIAVTGGPMENTYWTPREILQEYGGFFRSVDPGYWVKALFEIVDGREYRNVIVTDVRMHNEAKAIKDRGGLVIKVSKETRSEIHGSNDVSENSLDAFESDISIENDGSLEELKARAEDICETIKILTGGR